MYNIQAIIFPSSSKCMFSILKAEKVVNPPQIPVARNNRHCSFMKFPLIRLKPMINPIIKLPTIFTSKVAKGKLLVLNNKYTAYLNTDPINPPRPTSRK